MANGTVNLLIKSISDASGFTSAIDNSRRLADSFGFVGGHAKRLGTVVSLVGSGIGSVFKHLLEGGVWGVATKAISFVVDLVRKHKEEVEKAADAERKAFENRVKAIDEYRAAVDKCYSASVSAIDRNLKKINDEIDATHELQKAELELERERMRAAGDAAGASSVEDKMKELDASASAEKMLASISAAEKRVDAARKRAEDSPMAERAANEAAMLAGEAYQSAMDKVRAEAEKGARGDASVMTTVYGAVVIHAAATESQRKAAGDAAVKAFMETDGYRKLAESKKTADETLKRAHDERVKADEELETSRRHLENLGMRADAMIKRFDASEMKASNDAAEEREKADDVEAKKREDEAKREHEIRMKAIQDEEKARLDAERKVQAEATSRFEREFALYRDPNAMNRKFDEDDARKTDIERMKMDVLRTQSGAKVAEISNLMRAGDEAGVEARFASWRRGGYFSGMKREQEQLIRTAAAYENRNQSERNLAEIARNTAGLDQKLDQLLTMKGAE